MLILDNGEKGVHYLQGFDSVLHLPLSGQPQHLPNLLVELFTYKQVTGNRNKTFDVDLETLEASKRLTCELQPLPVMHLDEKSLPLILIRTKCFDQQFLTRI